MGKQWADFIVDKTGGKGNILMVRGVAGTFVDQERTRAANDVFGKHPDIKTTEVYGNWDDGTAQKVVANALASSPKFDGVWSQGGDTGVVRAFQQAGQDIPPIAGEAENGFRKLDAQLKFPMLSIGQSPALSALSIKVALAILKGEKVPQSVSAPLPTATTDTLKAGENFFPDLPDSFFTPIYDPGLRPQLRCPYHPEPEGLTTARRKSPRRPGQSPGRRGPRVEQGLSLVRISCRPLPKEVSSMRGASPRASAASMRWKTPISPAVCGEIHALLGANGAGK